MGKYNLIPPTDLRLNQLSDQVNQADISNATIQEIISAMNEMAHGERSPERPELPSLVGLAAPQIGAFIRIILFDMNAMSNKANFDVDFRYVINPHITQASREEELGREGCYSTGDIAGAVFRSKRITVVGYSEVGEEVRYELEGFLARIVQHEVDHLNGIRFPDRVRSPEHLHTVAFDSAEFQDYREHWRDWAKHYPFTDWLKMKGDKND